MSSTSHEQAAEQAADLMRYLQTECTTAGRGRRGDVMSNRSRPAPSTGSSPLDINVHDCIERARNEITTWTQAAVDTPGVAPNGADAYEWMATATRDLSGHKAAHRDAMIRRHELVFAVRAGDHEAPRREPCPRCGCWSIVWSPRLGLAVCTWSRCADDDGEPSTWSLQQLAESSVRKTVLRRAT